MVIFAFKTLEMGQPVSAASAAFMKAAWSAVGTLAFTSRWALVMAKPLSSFSSLIVLVVSMISAVRLAAASWPLSAMEKQAAWAAPISSSGFVPGVPSKRVAKE